MQEVLNTVGKYAQEVPVVVHGEVGLQLVAQQERLTTQALLPMTVNSAVVQNVIPAAVGFILIQ